MSVRHRWMRPAVVLVLAVAGGMTASGPTVAATPRTATFVHTGGEQQWVVPAGVTSVRVDATGATGGRGVGGSAGGPGARAAATVPVIPGSVLYVEVGGVGADGVLQGRALVGGFNGGGASPAAYGQGGSGGGASDVRTVPRLQGAASLPSRLVTAAGGAGEGAASSTADPAQAGRVTPTARVRVPPVARDRRGCAAVQGRRRPRRGRLARPGPPARPAPGAVAAARRTPAAGVAEAVVSTAAGAAHRALAAEAARAGSTSVPPTWPSVAPPVQPR